MPASKRAGPYRVQSASITHQNISGDDTALVLKTWHRNTMPTAYNMPPACRDDSSTHMIKDTASSRACHQVIKIQHRGPHGPGNCSIPLSAWKWRGRRKQRFVTAAAAATAAAVVYTDDHINSAMWVRRFRAGMMRERRSTALSQK